MRLRVVLIFLFVVFFQFNSFSIKNDSLVNAVFTLIYNQNFDEAENALQKNQEEIDVFYYNMLNLDLFWWKYSMSRTKNDAGKLKQVLEDIYESDKNSSENKINHLVQSSYRFRYELKRFNIVGAMVLRSDIHKQIEEIGNPEFPLSDNKFKLYELYIALFEYSDNSINPFVINSKSEACKKSLSIIENYTHDNDLVVQTLAHYFLGRIYMKVQKEPEKAKIHFRYLSDKFPENTFFAKLATTL